MNTASGSAPLELRWLGRTDLEVSVLGFGCGFVGGLLVRGTAAEQKEAVARATDLGINYFDTAAMYGDSEVNLGRVLAELKFDAVIGSKVMVGEAQKGVIGRTIEESVEASLKRLRRSHIDLMQLHNCVGVEELPSMRPFSLTVDQILNEAVPALERLRQAGKLRYIGMSGIGRTSALEQLVASERFDTVQVIYNLLNPSAVESVADTFPAQDFQGLMRNASERGIGVIGIRALAGGALSGSTARHPTGNATVDPLGSGASYEDDVTRANLFESLVSQGEAASLVDASLRYVIGNTAVATTVIGFSSREQIEQAVESARARPLGQAALIRCREIQSSFVALPPKGQ